MGGVGNLLPVLWVLQIVSRGTRREGQTAASGQEGIAINFLVGRFAIVLMLFGQCNSAACMQALLKELQSVPMAAPY